MEIMSNNSVKLNNKQEEAVLHYGSPLLILAGAGSGKTFVITSKIHHYITEKNIDPSSVLAITFTNKASKEMKERISKRLPDLSPANSPYIGTFHAFCSDVLRRHFNQLGGSNSFIIFDAYEQLKLMKQLVKSLNIDSKLYPESSVLSSIDRLKNDAIDSKTYASMTSDHRFDATVSTLYTAYQDALWKNKAVDFNDLILHTLTLFKTFPDVLSQYQERYTHLLVDEYQDTNNMQHELVRMFASKNRNITLVGDFDQNIYSWRGANIDHILNFEKEFQGSQIIKLEQNYRSTNKILEASNHLIKHNRKRLEKNLWTDNHDGHPLMSFTSQNEMEDAQYIVNEIRRLKQRGCSLNEMVVLYRINALSRNFEEALTKDQIPYRLVGGVSFFDRKEIKDIIGYLRLLHNVHDSMSFTRICNVPNRALGLTSVKRLLEQSEKHGISIYDLVRSDKLDLPSRAYKIVVQFFDMIDQLRDELSKLQTDKLGTIIKRIMELSGYEQMLKSENTLTSMDRLENLLELISYARQEEMELSEFLAKLSLTSDIDKADDQSQEAVTLMTMHTAKGLEFDFVFIPGFEEGILPHYRAKNNDSELEEERRLCYVAITRARKKVYLTHCVKRTLFGESRSQVTSRFLKEIPNHLLLHKSSDSIEQRLKESLSGGSKLNATDIGFKKQPEQAFQVGEKVSHAIWGDGFINAIEGQGGDAIIHLNFEGLEKKLIAKYAPLKRV